MSWRTSPEASFPLPATDRPTRSIRPGIVGGWQGWSHIVGRNAYTDRRPRNAPGKGCNNREFPAHACRGHAAQCGESSSRRGLDVDSRVLSRAPYSWALLYHTEVLMAQRFLQRRDDGSPRLGAGRQARPYLNPRKGSCDGTSFAFLGPVRYGEPCTDRLVCTVLRGGGVVVTSFRYLIRYPISWTMRTSGYASFPVLSSGRCARVSSSSGSTCSKLNLE
jgi:hypothetical protein